MSHQSNQHLDARHAAEWTNRRVSRTWRELLSDIGPVLVIPVAILIVSAMWVLRLRIAWIGVAAAPVLAGLIVLLGVIRNRYGIIARIRIVPANRVMILENIWIHRGLRFPMRVKELAVPLSEVRWTEFIPGIRGGPNFLLIKTAQGTIRLTPGAHGFGNLEWSLNEITRNARPRYWQTEWFLWTSIGLGLLLTMSGVTLIYLSHLHWPP